ncbi:hypothetical protein ACVWWD_002798 [Mesorhizobium sp. URHB0026]
MASGARALLSKFFGWEYSSRHDSRRGKRGPADRHEERAMKTYLAEVLGTFLLVFIGTASVVTGGFGGALPLGQEGIGLAFGIGLIAAAYAIGPISGAHLNPAVTLGVFPRRPAAGQGCHPLLDRADHRRHHRLAGVVDHRFRPNRRPYRRLRRQWLGRDEMGDELGVPMGTDRHLHLRHGDPWRYR